MWKLEPVSGRAWVTISFTGRMELAEKGPAARLKSRGNVTGPPWKVSAPAYPKSKRAQRRV